MDPPNPAGGGHSDGPSGGGLLFVFLDGVGIGAADERSNPFAAALTPFLRDLLGGPLAGGLQERAEPGLVIRPLDATLGHAGLPQSATGQATLLTGRNAAERMDGHYGPWPGPTILRLLGEGTLFHEARSAAGGALLANAFPPGYFTALESRRRRANVPVSAALAAGLDLLTLDDYAAGRGVAVDMTGAYFARLRPEIRAVTPAEEGARLARVASHVGFSFFDMWLTDDVGHRGSFDDAVALVEALDAFLGGVIGAASDLTVLVTSDHGNLEDKSVRTHTRNPVPLVAVGPAALEFGTAESLLDVAPAVRRILRPG